MVLKIMLMAVLMTLAGRVSSFAIGSRAFLRSTRLWSGFDLGPDAEPERGSSKAVLERIEEMVNETPIVLFMKGNPLFPQCGFSNTMVQILDQMGLQYTAHNVLEDDLIRQGIKDYSEWPTIPQLYLCGEFLGGTDIVLELYQSGELFEMIEVAAASAE